MGERDVRDGFEFDPMRGFVRPVSASHGRNPGAQDFVEKIHGARIDQGLGRSRGQAAQAFQCRGHGGMMRLISSEFGFDRVEMRSDLLLMWFGRIMRSDVINQIPHTAHRELSLRPGAFLVVRVVRSHVDHSSCRAVIGSMQVTRKHASATHVINIWLAEGGSMVQEAME
jgi:hypothetical protein